MSGSLFRGRVREAPFSVGRVWDTVFCEETGSTANWVSLRFISGCLCLGAVWGVVSWGGNGSAPGLLSLTETVPPLVSLVFTALPLASLIFSAGPLPLGISGCLLVSGTAFATSPWLAVRALPPFSRVLIWSARSRTAFSLPLTAACGAFSVGEGTVSSPIGSRVLTVTEDVSPLVDL